MGTQLSAFVYLAGSQGEKTNVSVYISQKITEGAVNHSWSEGKWVIIVAYIKDEWRLKRRSLWLFKHADFCSKYA